MSMFANFDDLQAQLSEIHAALLDKSYRGKELPLYAYGTVSKTNIVYQGSLSGRMIEAWDKTWYHNPHTLNSALDTILNTFFNHAVHTAFHGRLRRQWHHMRQIERTWKKVPSTQEKAEQRVHFISQLALELRGSVEENDRAYWIYFDNRSSDPFTEREERQHRQMIVNFHQATAIFWSFFLKDKHKDLRKPLEPLLNASATLSDKIFYKVLKNERGWTQFEEVMQMPIPVSLFSKLHDPSSLSADEEEHLESWINRLNQCKNVISLKQLSVILKEAHSIIHLQGFSPLTLQDLLHWIDKQGCTILHCEDAAHMDWREKLQPGDKITCNGNELILGKQLSPDKPIDDECKVFELANFPDYVVKIANNRFRLLLEAKKAQDQEEHYGVRLVEKIANLETDPQLPAVDGLDREGRCVVLEKLSLPISDHQWTSDATELTQEDEKIALVLANHLFCMHQWFANAQNLSLSHLMFDQEGVLKSVRLLKKGPANYNEWEAHCLNASKDNPHVLTFLMRVSKLCEHAVAKYYRDAVAYTLKTGENDLLSRPLPLGHRESFYDKRISELCDQALELRRTTLQHVIARLRKKGEYSSQKEKDLQTKVSDRLQYFYNACPTPGILSTAQLQQQVLDSFTDPNWQEPPLDPDESTYYEEKYDLMMSYNHG